MGNLMGCRYSRSTDERLSYASRNYRGWSMATWGFSESADKQCPQCGSIYAVKYHQVPVKDMDSADCVVCGVELDRWKSTRYPIYTLKERGQWPKQIDNP